ncbi:MAG TPA: hypothetical protein VMW83_11585 [Spirochaetia bacterium]|nr:hypothetical protein [Spirochaetia bacterium]
MFNTWLCQSDVGCSTSKKGDCFSPVDIGTTTVVGVLVNLLIGECLAAAFNTNTQNTFGADVIARIEYGGQHPWGPCSVATPRRAGSQAAGAPV